MLLRTRGIVFHTISYSDSRVIAKIYTERAGLLSCIVSVSRGKKGKNKSSLLQPLSQVELVVDRRERGGLQGIRELSIDVPYRYLQHDIIKTSIALFLAEVLYKSVREEEANPQLFSFLSHSFQILDLHQDGIASFHLCFMVQLTKYLGFFPAKNTSGKESFFDLRNGVFRRTLPDHPLFMDVPEAALLELLMYSGYDDLCSLNLTGVQRNTFVKLFLSYYELHLDTIHDVKSHHILETVLN